MLIACFVRSGRVVDGWSSADETPTFLVEALTVEHAAELALMVVGQCRHDSCCTWINIVVHGDGRTHWFTTRRDAEGEWCAIRPHTADDLR